MSRSAGLIEIFLQPGEFYFGDATTRIRTLLGSCVAMTMWHPLHRVGGMCHYMLPTRRKRGGALDGRYADEAIEMFLREAARYNTPAGDYQIKLFGGGNMFPGYRPRVAGTDIGSSNIEAAHRLLERHRLILSAQDLGRSGHRYVIFDIHNGHVWVRHQRLPGD